MEEIIKCPVCGYEIMVQGKQEFNIKPYDFIALNDEDAIQVCNKIGLERIKKLMGLK